MIRVSRLDNTQFYVNADLIEVVEMTPDTVLSLTSGKKFVVRESADEIVSRIIAYRHAIQRGGHASAGLEDADLSDH